MKTKSVYAFLEGDEVYKVGTQNPLGMVSSIGTKRVKVKRHSDGKMVYMDPSKLYLGKEWHEYNKV